MCRNSPLIFDVFHLVLVCNPDLFFFFVSQFMNFEQLYTTVAFIQPHNHFDSFIPCLCIKTESMTLLLVLIINTKMYVSSPYQVFKNFNLFFITNLRKKIAIFNAFYTNIHLVWKNLFQSYLTKKLSNKCNILLWYFKL